MYTPGWKFGWTLKKNTGSPPDDALALGNQTDGVGVLYSAVAETEWGTIPGKATGNTCWYPYGGKEHSTANFSWLCAAKGTYNTMKSDGSPPPPYAVKDGHQTDGAGDLYAAIAITRYGTIPGKAKQDYCWYSHGGEEFYTDIFSWVLVTLVSPEGYRLKPNEDGCPPYDAIKLGHQTDGAGDFYLAVADTKWGKIPGKAKDRTCWYPYEGKEYFTSDHDFYWICTSKEASLCESDGSGPPPHALKVGLQTDGACRGELYSAVAITDQGKIPGKAKDNTCWYPYNTKEFHTDKFSWAIVRPYTPTNSPGP